MDTETGKIIDAIIKAEGGDKETNDPTDRGGRTKFGLSEKSNPEVWKDNEVTLEEARATYFKKYVEAPGFSQIKNFNLQHQLVDFGVNSGPFVAIQKLQTALRVEVDGRLGKNTLDALEKSNQPTINNLVVAERVKLLCKICVKNPAQLKFLNGWVNRALEFLV